MAFNNMWRKLWWKRAMVTDDQLPWERLEGTATEGTVSRKSWWQEDQIK